MITVVRAFWGDEQIANWPRAMRDVQFYVNRKQRAAEALGCNEAVFCYGQQNQRFLTKYGIESMLATDGPVLSRRTLRFRRGGDSCGHVNYGWGMWRHKLDALRRAFEAGADEVVWLDWDTLWDETQRDVLATLRQGPCFQGRVRTFRNISPRFGGAAYYVAHVGFVEACLRVSDARPLADDQTIVTLAANALFFPKQEIVSAADHRRLGIDNPRLFGSKHDTLASDENEKPLFIENTTDPKNPRFGYRSRNDRLIRIQRVNCLART